MSKTVNVDSLTRVSTQYDPILRMLPYNELKARLAVLGFRFISSDKQLKEVEMQRKGGITVPYVPGATMEYADETMKLREAVLNPEWGKTAIKENIMNYEAVNVIGNSPENVDPVTKKHPLELVIIQNVIKTVGEDILDALYHAERDSADKSPFGLFDGINHLIDTEVAAGNLSTAHGNVYNTGAIVAPTTTTTAYDQLVAFVRNSDRFLRKFGILKITPKIYFYMCDALRNKLKTTDLISDSVFMQNLTADTNSPQSMKLSIEDEMGTGDRIMLTIPDNFDFSLWTESAASFVQVRSPFEDPNDVQFWMQFKAGSRIRSIHKKSFMINNGTAVAGQLSGDYLS
jgi:hypothetical protein